MKTEKTEVANVVNHLSPADRFTNEVVKQFSQNNGRVDLTEFQQRLIQNYFIKLDSVLKESERKRLLKSEQNRDSVAVTWENVNMQKLATEVVIFSKLGLDPTLPNHLNLIPYKNNSTGKYDITGIIGYRGLELKAKKYGLEIPNDVVVEVVYSNDVFKPIKKGHSNIIESYEFEIANPFNRGEIVGGFYYHAFSDASKNKLRIFSMTDIEKRKPAYASAEFWGGEKDVYVNGKKTKQIVDGWLDEMVYKTIYRAAFNDITLDAQKIDDVLTLVLQMENEAENQNRLIQENKTVDAEIKTIQIEAAAEKELISFVEEKQTELQEVENKETNKTLFENQAPEF